MNYDMFPSDVHMIKLSDGDFEMTNNEVKIKNSDFNNKNGYIMAYASWCPNCQNKKQYWSQMADSLNSRPKFKGKNIRIGVISTTDPKATQITKKLNITYIPRFFNVVDGGKMTDYEGEYDPKSMMTHALKLRKSAMKK